MGTNDVDPAWSAGKKTARPVSDNNVVFDSKNIDKKPKTEYFVKVEGAEERKKEVVRRLKEQKQELAKQARQDKRDAKLAAFAQARQTRRAKIKNAIKHFFQKFKIPLLAVSAVAVLCLASLAVHRIINPPLTEDELASIETIRTQNQVDVEFDQKAKEIMSSDTGSPEEVIAWTEAEIAKTDDASRKFELYSHLVNLVKTDENTIDQAFPYLEEMEKLASNSEQYVAVYTLYSLTYYRKGDLNKYEEYVNKSQEYAQKMDRIRLEGGG